MNPMQILSQIMGNKAVKDNPIMGNAISMYQQNDVNGLQNLANNLAKERGVDINQMYNNLMNQFNIKS